MNNQINQEFVNKINSLLDKGVTFGVSEDPKPGKMCVEQAVCYALGEEITDRPSCVGKEIRDFVTCLNDQEWSSASARAEGMRGLAIAQLGSNSLDQNEFLEKLSFTTITKLLPSMFRDLGEEKWEKEIKSLERAKDLKEAIKTAYDAIEVPYDVSDAACAIYCAANVKYIKDGADAANTSRYAAYATKTGDKYFKMASHLAVEVLKDMKSPGCQFVC